MTHYAALSEALTRVSNTPGRPLVFRGTKVHLRDFIAQFEQISQDEFLEQHSGVRSEQIRIVSELYSDILMDSDSEDDARRQIRQQADWALLSEAVSREIERSSVELSNPPSRHEFTELALRMAIDIGAETDRTASGGRSRTSPSGEWYGGQGFAEADTDPAREASDKLNDACIRLERAVELLARSSHPALSSYTQHLTNRIDEILAEMRSRSAID